MKTRRGFRGRLIALGLFLAVTMTAQERPKELAIARFHGDRAAAISYTFDDGKKDSSDVARPMFEARGMRMTFFIIASITPETDAEADAKRPSAHGRISWESLRKFSANGHEVGNHSWSHQGFVNGPDEGFELQIDKARELITEKMGAPPLTYCFPGNGYNAKALEWVLRTHIAARTKQFEIGKETFTAAQGNAWVDERIARKEWGVTMSHSITEGGFRLSSPGVLAEHLDYVKTKENQVWVDTFANVALYTREQKVAKATAEWADRAVTVTVESALDPAVFKHPLTVIVPVAGARTATAGTSPVVVRQNDLLVDIVPNGKPVRVVWE